MKLPQLITYTRK